MDSPAPPLLERANSLYWDSDRSVNEIADDLDMSKSALYGVVEPLATDHLCADCGAGLVFTNRTARDKGLLTCPACGAEEEEALLLAATRRGSRRIVRRLAHASGLPSPARATVAAALLGLAAGLVISRVIRKR